MKYDEPQRRVLKRFIKQTLPFGPPDAARISNEEAIALLYDFRNQAFADLVHGSDLLIGRRGSGKSALVKTFASRPWLNSVLATEAGRQFREQFHLSAKALLAKPDLIIEVDTPAEINRIANQIAKQAVPPPVELIGRYWILRLWLLIFTRLKQTLGGTLPPAVSSILENEQYIAQILRALRDGEVNLSAGSDSDWYETYQGWIDTLEREFSRIGKTVVVIVDSMEKYDPQAQHERALGGLLRATSEFSMRGEESLSIKVCIPAELVEEIFRISGNNDKDFYSPQYLHWTSHELWQLAAHRLRIFFNLYNEMEFALVRDVDLTNRAALRAFWHRYFPENIKNLLGQNEDTLTYILRHTQLLPRQLLEVLNNIFKEQLRLRSAGHSGLPFVQLFAESAVQNGISNSELINVTSVHEMLRPLLPQIKDVLGLTLPRLEYVHSYGELQSVWQSSVKGIMTQMARPAFPQFCRVLLSLGAIGLVDEVASSDRYVVGRFEFNVQHLLHASEQERFCIHPMFSSTFNVKRRKGDNSVVLPRGSEFNV